jgi:hypothetical protein
VDQNLQHEIIGRRHTSAGAMPGVVDVEKLGQVLGGSPNRSVCLAPEAGGRGEAPSFSEAVSEGRRRSLLSWLVAVRGRGKQQFVAP